MSNAQSADLAPRATGAIVPLQQRCICESGELCLGTPGQEGPVACRACLLLDPEEDCIRVWSGEMAATLRRAARLMRERAEAATQPEWAEWHMIEDGRVEVFVPNGTMSTETVFEFKDYTDCEECARPSEADLLHIASWHPAVALAVADLLDNEANAMDRADGFARDYSVLRTVPYNEARRTLLGTIASTFLGERIPPEGDLRARLAEAEAERDRALARESDLKAVRDGLLERLEAAEYRIPPVKEDPCNS